MTTGLMATADAGITADNPQTGAGETPLPQGITPAVGAPSAKPEFLPDEFWDKDKAAPLLENLVKSQRDLREKVSKGLREPAPESPDKYDFKFDEGINQIAADDPGLKTFRDAAHKAGLSQGQANQLMNAFLAGSKDWQPKEASPEEVEAYTKAEMAKLHSDPVEANKIVNGVVQFFKTKVAQGVLEEADYQALVGMGAGADGVRALRRLISVVYSNPEIPGNNIMPAGDYSMTQYYADVASERYASDPQFRAECKAKLERIVGSGTGQAPQGFGMPKAAPYKPPARY